MNKRDNPSQPGQSEKVRKTLRGRADKACVRCRAKKRTCDGGNPCMRCKESHSACYFSDWHYAVPYPREYVEYLEEQQEQLSIALLSLRRLLNEANVQTVPSLPNTEQAQDLLGPLRIAKLDRCSSQPLHPVGAPHGMNTTMCDYEDGAISPVQQRPPVSVVDSTCTSPIQPSIFPPLYRTLSNQSTLKPPRPAPRCSSLILPLHHSEMVTMPMQPRMSSDPCTSGSSSGGGGSPAVGTMSAATPMSVLEAPWPNPSRSLPGSAPHSVSLGHQTPLTPSSGTLTSQSDNKSVPNWTWMFGSEFGLAGTDYSSGQSGDVDLSWNDVNRSPWGES